MAYNVMAAFFQICWLTASITMLARSSTNKKKPYRDLIIASPQGRQNSFVHTLLKVQWLLVSAADTSLAHHSPLETLVSLEYTFCFHEDQDLTSFDDDPFVLLCVHKDSKLLSAQRGVATVG